MLRSKPHTNRGLVTTALLIVVGALFVFGGIYVYAKHKKNTTENAQITAAQNARENSGAPRTAIEFYAEMAWAKTRLKMETEKLEKLKAEAGAAFIIQDALKIGFNKISLAVFGATDILFTNPKTSPNFIPTTRTDIEISINLKRQEINKILDAWEDIANAPYTPGSNAALQNAINISLPEVREYLEDLQEIIATLTPGTSGLTQAEIDAYEKSLADAIAAVNAAAAALAAAQAAAATAVGTGTPSTPLTTAITQQETVVQDIQDEIDQLEEEAPTYTYTPPTGPNTATQGSAIIIYPQTPAATRKTQIKTGPQLIEGANSDL